VDAIEETADVADMKRASVAATVVPGRDVAPNVTVLAMPVHVIGPATMAVPSAAVLAIAPAPVMACAPATETTAAPNATVEAIPVHVIGPATTAVPSAAVEAIAPAPVIACVPVPAGMEE
jgi:hypothetical protein